VDMVGTTGRLVKWVSHRWAVKVEVARGGWVVTASPETIDVPTSSVKAH
jgi:hypothetical protein